MRQAPGPLIIDGITALVVFALMAQQLLTRHVLLPGQRPTTALTWLLTVVIVAPILTHRRFPIASAAVCLAAVALFAVGHYVAYPGYAIFVLTFGIALHSDEQVSVPTLFVSAVVLGVAVDLQPAKVAVLSTYLLSEVLVGAAWLTGWNLRRRRARCTELQARTERLEREREEQARRAVTEERLRIARELHDVIAHSMSVIAVQSAVGNHVIDTQPAEARQALAAIEATSRSALTEMRRLLGVLRSPESPDGTTPQPGLQEVDDLIDRVRDAGLSIRVTRRGEPRTLPAGMGLAAYRIVQEALTNTLKHAGPTAHADVTITYADHCFEVLVDDDGRATQPAPARPGQGLTGMRERAAMYGGTVMTRVKPDGGYRVVASLPIPT
jgi:signal transduction histidine kinase